MRTAKEILDDLSGDYGWKFYDEAIDFLLDWQSVHEDLGIVDCDIVDDIVKVRLDSSGYQGVICLLDGIRNAMSDSFYRIDGYGNLETIDYTDLKCWLDDIANDRL